MRSLPVTLRAMSSRGGLRRVLVAYALYDFVEFFVWLAIILYAYAEGGAPLAGVAALVQLVPAAVLAPALAAVGDRMPRGRALVLVHASVAIACLLTMVALVVDAPVPVVLLASGLATLAIAVVRPVHFAALPQLAAGPDELVSANMLSSLSDGVVRFAGPVAAGIVVAAYGPWLVFAIATGVSTTATVLVLRLDLGASAPDDGGEGDLREAVRGLLALWGDWASLALLLVMTVDFLLMGALDVLGVSFAESVLGREQTGAGLLIGSVGIGALAGALVGGNLARRRALSPVVVLGAVLEGVCFAAVAAVGALTPAMVLLAVAGAGGAFTMVAGRTLLQRSTDDRILARVFAVQESTALLGTALGAIVAPLLIAWLSPAGAFVPLGIGAALFGLSAWVLIKRLDARSTYLPVELDLLRGVPFLSVLRPYALERLARGARWVDVGAGADVVRQGERGAEFFVIAAGAFVAIVDGVRRPYPMGPGTGFGEIALMRSIPRTATVTCVEPGRLLVVGGDQFLSAVQGSDDGAAIAHEISAHHLARDERLGP